MTVNRNRINRMQFSQVADVAGSGNVAGAEVPSEVLDTNKKETKVIGKTEFGTKRADTFSVTVSSDEIDPETKKKKVLYENEEEPFEYEAVDGFTQMLLHAGAKLSEDNITFLEGAIAPEKNEAGEETADSKTTGKATNSIVKMYNSRLKADAKSSAYQSVVNKYKPLEGESKRTAQARTVANMIKLGGVSAEVAIETLKTIKALPEDYTVNDFEQTPLRRTKGDSDE